MTKIRMKVTKSWIKSNFKKFNALYFGKKLPTPSFLIINSKSCWGQCGIKYSKAFGNIYCIRISNYYDREEFDFQNTLLHEMIHLHFYSIGDIEERHGMKFREMALALNKQGWNIRIMKDKKTNHKPQYLLELDKQIRKVMKQI